MSTDEKAAAARRERAEKIASDTLSALDLGNDTEGRAKEDHQIEHAMHSGWLDAFALRAMLTNAALAGMEAAR